MSISLKDYRKSADFFLKNCVILLKNSEQLLFRLKIADKTPILWNHCRKEKIFHKIICVKNAHFLKILWLKKTTDFVKRSLKKCTFHEKIAEKCRFCEKFLQKLKILRKITKKTQIYWKDCWKNADFHE